jgi:hypothetical protein
MAPTDPSRNFQTAMAFLREQWPDLSDQGRMELAVVRHVRDIHFSQRAPEAGGPVPDPAPDPPLSPDWRRVAMAAGRTQVTAEFSWMKLREARGRLSTKTMEALQLIVHGRLSEGDRESLLQVRDVLSAIQREVDPDRRL